jgi:hypothetical protein
MADIGRQPGDAVQEDIEFPIFHRIGFSQRRTGPARQAAGFFHVPIGGKRLQRRE